MQKNPRSNKKVTMQSTLNQFIEAPGFLLSDFLFSSEFTRIYFVVIPVNLLDEDFKQVIGQ